MPQDGNFPVKFTFTHPSVPGIVLGGLPLEHPRGASPSIKFLPLEPPEQALLRSTCTIWLNAE
jgi:hypothetical protein